ncbi:MAG: hypothetical protein ACE5I1_08515 [bacterium]
MIDVKRFRVILMLVVALVLAFFGLATAQSSVVSLIAAKDNTIYAHNATLSNGAGAGMFAGADGQNRIKRALVYFAIADSIPANATVDSVRLTMSMSQTSGVGTAAISLHRVLADWGEGTSDATGIGGGGGGGGAPAMTGDAKWVHRFFNTNTWNTQGGDFSQTISASAQVGGFAFYTWGSIQQMVTDVQEWVKNIGEYEILFDASKLTSGVYVYQINVNGFIDTKKLTLVK